MFGRALPIDCSMISARLLCADLMATMPNRAILPINLERVSTMSKRYKSEFAESPRGKIRRDTRAIVRAAKRMFITAI